TTRSRAGIARSGSPPSRQPCLQNTSSNLQVQTMIQTLIVGVIFDDPDNENCVRRIEAVLHRPSTNDIENNLRRLYDKCVTSEHPEAMSSEHRQSSGSSRPSGRQRLATEKQIRAIETMARKQGFDLRRHLSDEVGASSVSALTIREASSLIDLLKEQLASA
ncbi:hypothetical protein, partial [Rhodopirellula bahusiensis]|uniref:hypothetical protein n=2 Tax=Rhodopirellula bahusiensis TaxID=2014065 RepID=UPI003298E39B